MRKTIALAFASAVIIAPAMVPAQFQMANPIAMIPKDVQFVIGIDIAASRNPESFVGSLVPIEQLQAMAKQSGAVGMDEEMANKMDSFVVGMKMDMAQGTQSIYGVGVGSFTRDDLAKSLQASGMPIPEANQAVLVSKEAMAAHGNTTIPAETPDMYMGAPKDGIVTFSTDQQWAANAMTVYENQSGMAAADSSFRSFVPALGGRNPEILIYIDGATVRTATQQDPSAAMMMAPIAQAEGIGFALFSGAPATLELHLPFKEEAQAQTADMFLKQGVEMLKAQAGQMAQMGAADPNMAQGIEMLDKIQIGSVGKLASAKVPIEISEEQKAAFRQQILSSMEQNMQTTAPAEMPQ